jgi:surface protein
MFYNCISLSSIPDIKDLDISLINDYYLMFYNCISLIIFANKDIDNLYNFSNKNELLLGIIITKYLKYENEIIIKNINEDDKGNINIFNKKLNINKNESIVINGNINMDLIVINKNEEKNGNEDNDLIVFNKEENKGKNNKEVKIKIIIINKLKNNIIKTKKYDISKWNMDNVIDMSFMFYKCSSLKELIFSNFTTNNVTDMRCMFFDCKLLKKLDLSNFNTERVINMSWMFNNCSSLKELNISSFDTENVTNMQEMFSGCSAIKELKISEFNTDNVNIMKGLLIGCSDELKEKILRQLNDKQINEALYY